MAYGNMTPAVSGQPASSAANNVIITNVDDLDTRLDVVETRTTDASTGNTQLGTRVTNLESVTTNTTTNGGHGNVRLSDRLGTGVGTGSNVTTGSATSQLTDVRSRLTVVEGSLGVSVLAVLLTALSGTTSTLGDGATFNGLNLNSTIKNVGGGVVSTVGGVTRWTPGTAGLYRFHGTVVGPAEAGTTGARIYVDGVTVRHAPYVTNYSSGTATFQSASCTAEVILTAASYVELRGWNSTVGKLTTSSSAIASFLAGEFVSA